MAGGVGGAPGSVFFFFGFLRVFWVPNLSDGNSHTASSLSRRPLPFSPPLRHRATNFSRLNRRQAGSPPSCVSCSLGVQSLGSGLAGGHTVKGYSPPAPGIPVCLGEVEAGSCGLTASGSKSTNRCALVFVRTVGVYPFMVSISGTIVCAGRIDDGAGFDTCVFRYFLALI